MEMYDLGDKNLYGMMDAPSKKKLRYPTQTFKKEQFPELFDKDIGDTCRAEVVLKVVGKRINESANSNKSTVEVEIRKIGYIAHAGGKSYKELEGMSKEEREKDREDSLKEKE